MYRKKEHTSRVMTTALFLVTLVLSIITLIAAISVLFERKKEEEELEHYLDGSIQ